MPLCRRSKTAFQLITSTSRSRSIVTPPASLCRHSEGVASCTMKMCSHVLYMSFA